jgi:anti-sigma factor RsiW
MNEHDIGRLRAYLDGELSPEEGQAITAHVGQCARCAEEMKLLSSRAEEARGCLASLETAPPDTASALARFNAGQRAVAPERLSFGNLLRRIGEMKQTTLSLRWRPAMIALSALVVVALLFTIAPVRNVAADFLGLFRIRKFAVIPLDPAQMQRLEQLARQAEGSFSEPQVAREPGPAQTVSDLAQASSLAGFAVRSPSRLPDGVALERFVVQRGPALHWEVDRAAVEAFMQAAGVSTQGLPQTDKLAADVDIANMVTQQYALGRGQLELVQAPNPDVKLPEGLDPVALAETGFMLLGMPAEDARRMATSIDWTSTLVVPLPANAVSAREVTVDGVTGLLLEGRETGHRDYALLWENGGILHAMKSRDVEEKVLLDAADSLR